MPHRSALGTWGSEMHNWPTVCVEPCSCEGECRARADHKTEHISVECNRGLKIICGDGHVINAHRQPATQRGGGGQSRSAGPERGDSPPFSKWVFRGLGLFGWQ